MRQPTPAEIRLSIFSALNADDLETHDEPMQRIPVRVWTLIDMAVSAACDRAERRNS